MYSPFDKFPAKKRSVKRRKSSASQSAGSQTPQNRKKPQPQVKPLGLGGLPPAPKPPSRAKESTRPAQKAAASRKTSGREENRKTSQKKGSPSRDTSRRPASFARHRRRRIKWGRLIIVLCGAVGLGYLVSWFAVTAIPIFARRLANDFTQIAHNASPLPYSNKAYLTLSRQIASYVRSQPGTYGVAGVDLTTGVSFGFGRHTQFSAGGTMALPVAITLYSDIAAKTASPSTVVKLTPADEQAGPGYIGGMPYGTSLTVSELARASLVSSDVVATNMLIRTLGKSQIDSFIAAMGSSVRLVQPYVVTPSDLAMFMDYLYTMDQAHPRSVKPLMNDLQSVPADGRIQAGFPTGTHIAQIQGNWPNEFHDDAIVWTAGHPVALAICSNGVTSAQAAAVEAHVASLVAAFEKSGR